MMNRFQTETNQKPERRHNQARLLEKAYHNGFKDGIAEERARMQQRIEELMEKMQNG